MMRIQKIPISLGILSSPNMFDYEESSVTFMRQSRNIIKYDTRNDFILANIRILEINMILLIFSTLYCIFIKIRFIITY